MRLHYPLNSNGAEDAGQLPWTDGVPATGVEGSYPGHAIVTDAEAEILAAIDGGGFVRSGTDLTQLLQTISRGIWLGVFAGSATALTATLPNSLVLPSLQAGMRVRGIAASNYTGGGGTLKITGIGAAATTVSYPIVGSDGVTALATGAWSVGQFLTFEIDGSGNARFGGAGLGSGGSSVSPTRVLYMTASQTLTVQAGETRARVRGFAGGGGGGGSYSNPSGGSGGGGGGSFDALITGLTANQQVACTVGPGGTAGPAAASGQAGAGGTTSFGSYASATGGTGGYASSAIGVGSVGAGGSASLANGVAGQTYTGANGGSAYPIGNNNPMSGYGGGCQMGGQASTWGANSVATNASPGNFPGGGANSGIDQGAGGVGGAGLLIVELYP